VNQRGALGTVLVAGARGGIGGACVTAIEHAGGTVFGVDRSDVSDDAAGDDSGPVHGPFDVTLPGGAEEAVAGAVAAYGRFDGVVHAVGMSGRRLGDGGIVDCTDEAWSEVHRVNHESVFRLLRASIPALAKGGGGSIVVIGSVLGTSLDADFHTVAYASAKGGLIPLIRAAAREAAAGGVRVNLISAGLVATPMSRRAQADDAIRERLPELMPLGGRFCEPREVAAAAVWLLSDASARTTGAVLPVDGGWHLR
jgi:NAD(P)-dependent dehydrogenase (short-subunit alcohol dehydrogenase family)